MRIQIYDLGSGRTMQIDKALRYSEGNLEGFTGSWSSDSRWFAYSRDLENSHGAIFLYDYTNHLKRQITNGYYDCSNPVFDREGKYIYLLTNQSFNPSYSDLDNSFIYGNAGQIATISLKKSTPSLLYPKNDTVAIQSEKQEPEKANPDSSKNKKGSKGSTAAEKKEAMKAVDIDLEGLEYRMVILPSLRVTI
jgi:tricorn protease